MQDRNRKCESLRLDLDTRRRTLVALEGEQAHVCYHETRYNFHTLLRFSNVHACISDSAITKMKSSDRGFAFLCTPVCLHLSHMICGHAEKVEKLKTKAAKADPKELEKLEYKRITEADKTMREYYGPCLWSVVSIVYGLCERMS